MSDCEPVGGCCEGSLLVGSDVGAELGCRPRDAEVNREDVVVGESGSDGVESIVED